MTDRECIKELHTRLEDLNYRIGRAKTAVELAANCLAQSVDDGRDTVTATVTLALLLPAIDALGATPELSPTALAAAERHNEDFRKLMARWREEEKEAAA